MSDSIWNISPIGNHYRYLNQNVYMPKTSVLNTLVATMIRINRNSTGFYTVRELAKMAYNEMYERSPKKLESSFSGEADAINTMVSEYRNRSIR